MIYLIVNWAFGTLGLFLLSVFLPWFRIMELQSAVIAAAVVALVHAAISTVFRPSIGSASFVFSSMLLFMLDVVVFRVSALLVPGFVMRGFMPAIAGAMFLVAVNALLPRLIREREQPVESLIRS